MFEINRKDIGNGIKMLMKVKQFDVAINQDTLSVLGEVKPYQLSKIINGVADYSPDLFTVSKIISGGFDMTLRQFFLFLEELETDRE